MTGWIYSTPTTNIEKCFVSFIYKDKPTIAISKFKDGKFFLYDTNLIINNAYAYQLYPVPADPVNFVKNKGAD